MRTIELMTILMLMATPAVATDELAAAADEQHGDFLGAAETHYPDWFKSSFLDLADDVDEAGTSGRRVMLLFHQDGCPYCNAFVERNLAQQDIAEALQAEFDVIAMNIFGDHEVAAIDGQIYTEKTFSAALGVQFTPTVIFLDEAGSPLLRIDGYRDPDRFRDALAYVQSPTAGSETFNDFLAGHRSQTSSKGLPPREYLSGSAGAIATRPGRGEKPLLVLFEQGQCRNCEQLHDDILNLTETRDLLEHFDVYQIDMWSRDEVTTPDQRTLAARDWARELGIDYAPSMVLYSKDGEEVIRSSAWFRRFHTQAILDYVAGEHWREQPEFQRYLSGRAEAIRASGRDVNIWD